MRRALTMALVAALAAPAAAWEPDTTHAALTEAAALSSRLNARLRQLHARKSGWLEPLALARDRAPALYQKLGLVEPSSGVVPDRRGRQSALAWLVAGAVLEGIPADRDRNHFYDPLHKKGLGGGPGIFSPAIWGTLGGEGVPGGGVAAPDWIVAKDNDLSLSRFWLEIERSATAGTRAERDEHLALAMLCAGAMMHVLEDVGAPAHARGDFAEHMLPLGAGPTDRGSRFERLAAFQYGRLGVPDPTEAPPRARARDFFTAADGKGLADLTAARWYSAGTLPRDILVPRDVAPGEVAKRIAAASRFPSPMPAHDPKLKGAAGPDGYALRDESGVCLANYRVEAQTLHFYISDACAAEQLAVILPEVGGYAAAFLDWLFRGGLAVTVSGGQATVTMPASEAKLGAGRLTVLAEDSQGTRRPLGTTALPVGASPPPVPVPAGTVRVVAVFHGVDANGEEIVAVGAGTP